MSNPTWHAFLKRHALQRGAADRRRITHTRIPGRGPGGEQVFGGSYHVPPEALPEFWARYAAFVRAGGREHLTEAQSRAEGPLLIDLDFRYRLADCLPGEGEGEGEGGGEGGGEGAPRRLHTREHVHDLVVLHLEHLKALVRVPEAGLRFPVFVLERAGPRLAGAGADALVKDGVHVVVGLALHAQLRARLREAVLREAPEICDLPLACDWAAVLDEGVARGSTNWPLFGSAKPGLAPYALTGVWDAAFEEGVWALRPAAFAGDPAGEAWASRLFGDAPFDPWAPAGFAMLSAQHAGWRALPLAAGVALLPERREEPAQAQQQQEPAQAQQAQQQAQQQGAQQPEAREPEARGDWLAQIRDAAALAEAVAAFLEGLGDEDAGLRDLHRATMLLPAEFYAPGSHDRNRQVAFALKRADERMFLTWAALRAKAADFDFGDLPALRDFWLTGCAPREGGVSARSIFFWARQAAPEAFAALERESLDHYVDQALLQPVEWNFARILHHLFKQDFVCTSHLARENRWYAFREHRWQEDKTLRLRAEISRRLFQVFEARRDGLFREAQAADPEGDARGALQRRLKTVSEVLARLKKTSDKNNIVREAVEFFCDDGFLARADTDPDLLCFTNGVFDFREGRFREGRPSDCLTKCTGVPFLGAAELAAPAAAAAAAEIDGWLAQLFPDAGLREYMRDHAAAALLGRKREQVFSIYVGSGGNGKSLWVDLMRAALGAYAVVVPVAMLTGDRQRLGQATPEIMVLKGARYAVSQETRAGDRFNDGVLKELTGGDPLSGRRMFGDTEEFASQFGLALCTNDLPVVESTDDGVWRRMRVLRFVSKFAEPGEAFADDTPHVFPKDKALKDKLPRWAPVWASLLALRAARTRGEVGMCAEVARASGEYRFSQDAAARFAAERLARDAAQPGLKIASLARQFREWFAELHGSARRAPAVKELERAVTARFGPRAASGAWPGVVAVAEPDAEE